MKKVFTIGQLARLLHVGPHTVRKWFDSGKLKGYRVPGSHDRRVPRDELIRFLKVNGMPLCGLEEEAGGEAANGGGQPRSEELALCLGAVESIRYLAERLAGHEDQGVVSALLYLRRFADTFERAILGPLRPLT
jgi:excisionase family DNA binding protein